MENISEPSVSPTIPEQQSERQGHFRLVTGIVAIILVAAAAGWFFMRGQVEKNVVPTPAVSAELPTDASIITTPAMTDDISTQFKSFFATLRAAADAKDTEAVKATLEPNFIASMQQLYQQTEQQVISGQIEDLTGIADNMVTKYSCKGTVCTATVTFDGGIDSEYRYQLKNARWYKLAESVPAVSQISEAALLTNNYQLSMNSNSSVSVSATLNGSPIASFTDDESHNVAIAPKKGKNILEFTLTPSDPSVTEATFVYIVYGFPPDAGSDAIFNADYQVATNQTKEDRFPKVEFSGNPQKVSVSFQAN